MTEPTSAVDKRLDEFSTWQKVEFRCMIQDILGNEIYNKQDSDKLGDRTIFYCITIPGENDWVRSAAANGFEQFDKLTKNNNEPLNSDGERLSFSLVNYSYPLPSDGKNRSCLIKVYDLNLVEFLRVNDIVQVEGFVEPSGFEDDSELLTNKNSPSSNGQSNVDGDANHSNGINRETSQPNEFERATSLKDDFEPASDFPHRLVPRVHVQTLRKLNHINPMLPGQISRDGLDLTRLRLARVRLETILTQLFGGDKLAAEYVILSLLSRIQRRKNELAIGQMSVNITGIKPEMKQLIEKLYSLISRITTHSHFLDLSIANLNNLQFTPQKDHDNNKMIAGTLQLPDGLFLMINETALSEGLLTQQGTSNLATLNHIIRWQSHKYDFKFHSVDIDTDLNILIMSEGKSVLAAPIILNLEYDDMDSIKQACESINDFLTDELLNMFRYYISVLRQPDAQNYQIPEEVQSIIEKDFVGFRRQTEAQNKPLFSADDLSSYMTLARLLTISRCEQTLSEQIWKDICQMEATRKLRLSSRVSM